jgi:hypothetical protein
MEITYRGWPGHYCRADSCIFRLNTLVEHNNKFIVISTSGNMRINNIMEMVSPSHQAHYETFIFYSHDQDPVYHDADPSRQIHLPPPFQPYILGKDNDLQANENHYSAVQIVCSMLEKGEL